MKIEAVPVKVRRGTYDKLKAYSQETGVPAARIIDEAIEDFLMTTGQARLEALRIVSPSVPFAIEHAYSMVPQLLDTPQDQLS